VSIAPSQQQPASLGPSPVSGVELDVIINHIPRDSITVDQPFNIAFIATVSATLPKAKGKQRVISLAVQHLQCPHSASIAISTLVTPVQGSPNTANENTVVSSPQKMLAHGGVPTLPPPYFEFADEEKRTQLKGCVFLGSSTLFLSPITLTSASHANNHEDLSDADVEKIEGSQKFELTFLPVQTGFVRAGGLRLLLVRDEITDVGADQASYHLGSGTREVRTLKEIDVVAELWVRS